MKLLIILSLFSVTLSSEFFQKREYSLTKPYSGSWNLFGTSVMSSDYVRLTNNHQSQIGGVVNLNPNIMRDWEIHLNFKVHGSDGNLFGDGLAFWYTAKPLQPGPVFGNQDYFKGLAIFLDTYSNHNGPHHHEHPYISAMISNGSLHYDHDTDGTHTQLSGCSAQFRNKMHDTLLAIRYVNNKLTVSHDINNDGNWKECFAVSNVKLPLGYYFGASAATGELADNHDIISIKTYEVEVDHSNDGYTDLYQIEPFAESIESPREHSEDDKPSFAWKVFKWIFYTIVFGLCCCVVAVSYYMYRKNEEQKKRLY